MPKSVHPFVYFQLYHFLEMPNFPPSKTSDYGNQQEHFKLPFPFTLSWCITGGGAENVAEAVFQLEAPEYRAFRHEWPDHGD
jgi:hypothetical protein